MEKTTGLTERTRVEAFSDGVFAIAITLLIIEIHAPKDLPAGVSLGEALAHLYPSYLAFLTSFATIGIMWINHHRIFTLIGRADQPLLVLNLLLLLGVTFVPFPTNVLAENIRHPSHARTAALFYSGTFFVIAVFFNILWRYASGRMWLIDEGIEAASVQAISDQYRFGPIVYLMGFVVAFFSAWASVLINLGLALFSGAAEVGHVVAQGTCFRSQKSECRTLNTEVLDSGF